MPVITFQDVDYECAPSETVLECLTRHGASIPHSCRSGVCHSCLMLALHGDPPADAQKGLKDTLQVNGYFLACLCKPQSDLDVTLPGRDVTHRVSTRVLDKTMLNDTTVRLRLEPEVPFPYRPGQFINLYRYDGLARSYSIASLPQHGEALELHVRRMKSGQMSTWIHHDLKVGDHVSVEGPIGNCFYVPGQPQQPLLLAGTGCGIAPLWGVMRDALDQGHEGPVHLFHGSFTKGGLYLVDEMRETAARYSNFHYIPCVDEGDDAGGFQIGRIDKVVAAMLPNLKGWRVFLCGVPEMVKGMQRSTFMAGASMHDIYADPFG